MREFMSEANNIEAPKVAGEYAPDVYERWAQVAQAAANVENVE